MREDIPTILGMETGAADESIALHLAEGLQFPLELALRIGGRGTREKRRLRCLLKAVSLRMPLAVRPRDKRHAITGPEVFHLLRVHEDVSLVPLEGLRTADESVALGGIKGLDGADPRGLVLSILRDVYRLRLTALVDADGKAHSGPHGETFQLLICEENVAAVELINLWTSDETKTLVQVDEFDEALVHKGIVIVAVLSRV
mmetsp:Transcript_44417/g.96548  ORF Transcript_44417/g.96548 Transcript_44417/m.96548 type:complete len:202 (-) Transcript_44417:1305-1910(-)